MQFTEQHATHRTAMGEPFGSVAEDHAEPFGGGVVFEDDRTAPRDRLLLNRNRARSSAMTVDDKTAVDPRTPRHRLQCNVALVCRGDAFDSLLSRI
jgi:hypothetical protein